MNKLLILISTVLIVSIFTGCGEIKEEKETTVKTENIEAPPAVPNVN